jgi:hypothetical protein
MLKEDTDDAEQNRVGHDLRLDRSSHHGISAGTAVIDTAGVVGLEVIGSNSLDVPGTLTLTQTRPDEAALDSDRRRCWWVA